VIVVGANVLLIESVPLTSRLTVPAEDQLREKAVDVSEVESGLWHILIIARINVSII